MDSDVLRLWAIVQELSDQLALNQTITATLQQQAAALKACLVMKSTQSTDAASGFALRRFNTDITKETFESELERFSAQTVIENQTLLHENKQLSLLLKEYESTMETIMSKFRTHAVRLALCIVPLQLSESLVQLAAQRHDLILTRHYETLLHTRETQFFSSDLLSSTEMAQVLQRLSHHLRGLLRSLAGEPPDPTDLLYDGSMDLDIEPESDAPVDLSELEQLLATLSEKGISEGDWAEEREVEIARLEKENAELKRLLHIDKETMDASGVFIDETRDNPSRFNKLVPRRIQEGGDPKMRPGFWVDHPTAPQLLHQDLQLLSGPGMGHMSAYPPPHVGSSLQRALDLQPGMRMGARGQGRRPGIIGRGARQGGFGPGFMGEHWQPPQPAPWQAPIGTNMDLLR
ncbi:hypothetical protein H0H92_008719 [Tricholoma furcatifolium]|nr:hypothetical protein H0H92_008719 [Tricholoma furcatifolium]